MLALISKDNTNLFDNKKRQEWVTYYRVGECFKVENSVIIIHFTVKNKTIFWNLKHIADVWSK